MKSVFKKIFKTLITSFFICFCAMIILMISNKIMGVDRVGMAYVLLGGLCFLMLSVGLILARFDYIFKKENPKKINKKPNEKPKQKTKTHPKNIQRKSRKREIS
ncbi:hypothetical protein [Intestinibacter sp.]